jgi:hypothetical protein
MCVSQKASLIIIKKREIGGTFFKFQQQKGGRKKKAPFHWKSEPKKECLYKYQDQNK